MARSKQRVLAPTSIGIDAAHRRTGAFLVIDAQDGSTLAAGMVRQHPGDSEDERYWI